MKKMKIIKISTITLAIILITMIAFFGIYKPVQNRMENQIKENAYAMDLKGSRIVKLTVNTGLAKTIKDTEGKVVTDSDNLTDEELTQKGYTKEETPYNSEEVKNAENYKVSKKVIETRLRKLGVKNYIIKVDEQVGDIVIELPENNETDTIINNVNTTGKFEIVDTQTGEVLMNNSAIKLAKVLYGSNNNMTNNGTTVYLDIEFNKEGRNKLEEISNLYKKVEKAEEQENTTSPEQNNSTEENNTTKEETEKEKTITMKIDNEEIMTTSFDEAIKTGKLQLSIGSSTKDSKTLRGYIEQASSMATVLDTGNIPVKYDLVQNQYILSDITENEMQIAIYVGLGIVLITLVVLMIRYKLLGVLGTISYIGFISLFMLVVPYTNIVLSIEGLLGIVMIFILNYIFVNKLLAKADKSIEVYKEFFVKMIPVIILVITFCFVSWVPVSSVGQVMFWGIVLIAVYNSLVTNSLLKINARKEK